MKKILLFVLIFSGFGASDIQAYCLVTHNSSNPGNIYSLPYMVATRYNDNGAEALCSNATGTLDRWLGFRQSIRFATLEAGNYYNVLGQRIDIQEITISLASRVITFDNSAVNVVVGNWSQDLPANTDYEYGYPINFDPEETIPRDYGAVIIDGTGLSSRTSPLKCAGATDPVILRNLVIETNGVTRAEFFDRTDPERSCFMDGGAVYVCTGQVTSAESAATDSDCQGSDTDEDEDDDTFTVAEGDCDDDNAEVNPDADEHCGDDIDNDCDGDTDRDDSECEEEVNPLDVDDDGDGTTDNEGDCDDENDAIHEGATDVCGNGTDEDCSGTDRVCDVIPGDEICGNSIDDDGINGIDCADPSCQFDLVACPGEPPVTGSENCEVAGDEDGDAYADCDDTDCDDHPSCLGDDGGDDGDDDDGDGGTTVENCTNGSDDDGDSYADCTDTECASLAVCTDPGNADADGDGFSINESDCDDTNPEIHPGKAESCDGIDNDCDASIDEVCAGELTDDDDGDGYCEDLVACADSTKKPGDCNDTSASINPAAIEYCSDDTDSNCNGMDDDEPAVPALTRDQVVGGGDVMDIPFGDDEGVVVEAPLTCVESVDPPKPDDDSGASGGCSCDLTDKGGAPTGSMMAILLFALLQPGFLALLRFRKSR
ncbi:MAG: putative metal-binding motif-containing protein [Deltaproteobacteria bacterium]|nr:putative metal-binding motif-containing protein [Deltaproteobacteria bacterium]